MINPTPADVERLIAETEAARMPETIFVWLNPAPDHYSGGWDTDPTNRNIRYVRHDVVDAALRAMQADMAVLEANKNAAHHWRRENLARAEAAEAKLAEVEKANRELGLEILAADEAREEAINRRDAADATVATLTAQVEAMRGALEKIATLAPPEKPPEPYDAYGWQVADTGERHAQMVRDHDMWLVADFARAALTTENQTNG